MKTWRWSVVLLALLIVGCSSRGRPPIVVPPPPPPPIEEPEPPPVDTCDVRPVIIYTLDAASRPIAGVRVFSDSPMLAEDQRERFSDGNGFTHRNACGPALYSFEYAGWHTTNCGEPGAACDLAGGEGLPHNVHLERDRPAPGSHPDPVNGALRVQGNGECIADDSGCHPIVIMHFGDLPLRDQTGNCGNCDEDLNDIQGAGYHVVRMWSHIRPGDGVWSRGGDPPYNGLDALNKADFVDREIGLFDRIAERGMRGTLETGGIDGINSSQERAIMLRFRDVGERAGWWKVAWVSPVNEPSSVHGTSDDNGDVDPRHLRELVDLARGGSRVLWHLGHANNGVWFDARDRFSQKNFTPADQPFGYYHAWRGGDFDDQARHRFSWLCPDCEGTDTPGRWKRLWLDGEGVGVPTCDGSLRCVSVARNGSQLDAEAQSLIVAVSTLRGAGSYMSGLGVQRYMRPRDNPGFFEVPWTVRQFPRDVQTWPTFVHGGRANAVFKAVQDARGLLRVEQSIASDGRVVAVAYADRENQSWQIPVTRAVRVSICDPGAMSCTGEFSVPAGGSVDIGRVRWGRVLIARPQ